MVKNVAGVDEIVGYARPQPDLLPQEKEQQMHVSDFADERPAIPVTRIFKKDGGRFSLSWRRGSG
jgi:hypothetical protein